MLCLDLNGGRGSLAHLSISFDLAGPQVRARRRILRPDLNDGRGALARLSISCDLVGPQVGAKLRLGGASSSKAVCRRENAIRTE